MNAIVFDIQRNSYVDGPGIRTSVFFKGCNLRCAWCHNPESQQSEPQIMFFEKKCVGCGRCKDISDSDTEFFCYHGARELYGKEYSSDELLAEILKDKLFYDCSGGGVTFSGGECMLRIEPLEEILKKCKAQGLHTAVDTAGHVPYEYFERILPHTDLFLYDVKCFDSEKHREYTGVGNERILDNLKKLLSDGVPLWIRIPIIPTVNDTEEEMTKIKTFLYSCGSPEKIELLPYHAMGEHKYAALGRDVRIFSEPTAEKMQALKQIFA